MKKIIAIFCMTIGVFFLLPRIGVNAADFDVNVTITYAVDQDGMMTVSEERVIQNNAENFIIPDTYEETFYISSFKIRSDITEQDLEKVANTITMHDGAGQELEYSVGYDDNTIVVKTPFLSKLDTNQERSFVLEYANFELIDITGNVWNMYVPGLPEGYNDLVVSDNGATTQTTYTVKFELDNTLDTPNFILPEPKETYEVDGVSGYVFDPENLIEKSGWIQIGTKQYYTFHITQEVTASESLSAKVFKQWYDLVLPSDSISSNQTVYFTEITPEPLYVRLDGEGNIIARFVFSNQETTEISVKGFIESNITETIESDEVGNVLDIPLQDEYAVFDEAIYTFSDLLQSQEYWEVENAKIQEVALEIKGDLTNVYDILLADYTYVTDTVDYDNLKIGVNNQRQGALKTLQGGSSVCMEYSDLLITILRAQGIPARAGFGYGFDHRAGVSESSDSTELASAQGVESEAHQWVEVYMPNIGWVAVDPTWGDTGRKNYIGGDVDHALWYVAGRGVDEPSPVVRYSLSDSSDLTPPTFTINVVETIDTTDVMTMDDMLAHYEYKPQHFLKEKYDQLNTYGKIVIIGIPGVIILILLLLITFSLIKFVNKLFKKDPEVTHIPVQQQ